MGFVQDPRSLAKQANAVHNLHSRMLPHACSKSVNVTWGRILDVIVNLFKCASSFDWDITGDLNTRNVAGLLISESFAHGCVILEDETKASYKTSDFIARYCDQGLVWFYLVFNIGRSVLPDDALVSEKDGASRQLNKLQRVF